MDQKKSRPQFQSQIPGFHVLPIEIPAAVEDWGRCFHFVYLRLHHPQFTKILGADKSINGRSLFVKNVPVDSTVHHFRAVFSKFSGARVEAVIFEDEPVPEMVRAKTQSDSNVSNRSSKKRKRKGNAAVPATDDSEIFAFPSTWDRKLHKCGSSATIVFVDEVALQTTMNALQNRPDVLDESDINIYWGDGIGEGNDIPPLGLARYATHEKLTYPDREELMEKINKAFEIYDAREAALLEKTAKAAMEPDEDGFITVGRGARTKPLPKADEQLEKKVAEKGVYKDFYRFQQRNVKKQRLRDIQSKFEGEIHDLKSNRRRTFSH